MPAVGSCYAYSVNITVIKYFPDISHSFYPGTIPPSFAQFLNALVKNQSVRIDKINNLNIIKFGKSAYMRLSAAINATYSDPETVIGS